MKKLIMLLVLLCAAVICTGCQKKEQASFTIPVPKPTAEPVEHVLPAPDVYFGLTDEAEHAPEEAGVSYCLEIVNYPEKSIAQYAQLLEEVYGLRIRPEKNEWNKWTTTLEDANGKKCVSIQWLSHKAGRMLMVRFGGHCATAALERLENAQDIRPVTEEDWMECSCCHGDALCYACDGKGEWYEWDLSMDFRGTVLCDVCDGDGRCPVSNCVQGRVFSPQEHYTKEEIRTALNNGDTSVLMDADFDELSDALFTHR